MHRSHDREALSESKAEPEPALGSGSSAAGQPGPDDLQLVLRQRQHDAANWLAVLRGHLDLLAHAPDAAPDLRAEWLDRARSAAAAAERLLRGAGAPASGTGLHSPLAGLLDRLAGHARTLLPGHARLSLEIGPLDDQRCVLADDDLEDVLLNLLRNAGQALDQRGGTIALRARAPEPGQVILEVEDDGSGMTAEVRDRCLTAGFTTRPGEGRGLGLSRVHAIVRAVQGRIEIDSEFGRGTRVRLILAAFEAASAPASATEGELGTRLGGNATEQATGRGPRAGLISRVLVIDDDADVREVMVALLEHLGAHASFAHDAQSARVRLREGAFDLVLVDRELPDLCGDDLAVEIRRAQPAAALVLLTGDPRPGPVGAVFDETLVKPVGLERLRELLEQGPRPVPRGTEDRNA